MHIHVFIHPASLCLLVGTFNPFTFKLIIDMYDTITVLSVVLGLFSVVRSFSFFLPREFHLAFVVKLV